MQLRWRKRLRKLKVLQMTIDADENRFDEIMKEVVAVCRKVEPDCVINI